VVLRCGQKYFFRLPAVWKLNPAQALLEISFSGSGQQLDRLEGSQRKHEDDNEKIQRALLEGFASNFFDSDQFARGYRG